MAKFAKTFMKRLSLLLTIFLVGCTSVNIPNYIPDKYPYKKTLYGDYGKVVRATEKTLGEFGWTITSRNDPSIFERTNAEDQHRNNQILIFTKVRATSLVVGTRYARLNAYVRSADDKTCEVELRYVTISSTSVKNFYNYRKDHLIERMFKRIEGLSK